MLLTSWILIIHVTYLINGFEYFFSGFACGPVPTEPSLVPSRSRRALSIPRVAFFLRPPPNWRKAQNTAKILVFLSGLRYGPIPIKPSLVPSRSRRALSIPRVAFPPRPFPPPPYRQKNPNTAEKRLKNSQILVIPSRICSWTGSN